AVVSSRSRLLSLPPCLSPFPRLVQPSGRSRRRYHPGPSTSAAASLGPRSILGERRAVGRPGQLGNWIGQLQRYSTGLLHRRSAKHASGQNERSANPGRTGELRQAGGDAYRCRAVAKRTEQPVPDREDRTEVAVELTVPT